MITNHHIIIIIIITIIITIIIVIIIIYKHIYVIVSILDPMRAICAIRLIIQLT